MLSVITIDINPIIVQLGPIALRWYGLMYVVGIAVGLWVAVPYARARGLDEDKVWSVVWPSIVVGLVGARLYYVLQQDLTPYLAEPWRIFATWEGGMAFYGAVFGVAVSLFVLCRWRGIDFWTLVDAAALFAVVGQAFGRLGNLVNGDIVGYPTDLPWGVIYAHPGSFVADHTIAYQPAAVYELLANLVLFAILWSLRFRLPRPGTLFTLYLFLYSVGQFAVFFLRTEPVVLIGLKQAQVTAIIVALAATALWVWRSSPSQRPTRMENAGGAGEAPAGSVDSILP